MTDTEDHPRRRPSAHLWVWPLVVLAAGTVACRLLPLDQRASALFFAVADGRWAGDAMLPVRLIQRYGDYPAVFLGIAGLWLATALLGPAELRPWRRAGIYLVISLALCHILVNPVLKKHYNRARPKETALFNGSRPFTPVLTPPAAEEKGRSFPSGHAAAGFAFVAVWFAFRDQNRRLAGWGLAVGLAHGLVNGLGRVLQGAHFPSDILWSFGVVWFTCLALYRWWHLPRLRPRE
jgi:membrane-associated PAP2 superfamily phosphatase